MTQHQVGNTCVQCTGNESDFVDSRDPDGTKYFKKSTAIQMNHQQMKECWVFAKADEFKICASGCPSGKTRKSSTRTLENGLGNPDYVTCQE
ncbi:MAG: hypothetical protein LBF28_00165 [Rickettsiales bacterium]|jgi:hypothetical protein|nr:hypothetical protein [Rickettsiales bacterium]